VSQTRLLFDECIGRPHVERLAQLIELEDEENRPTVEHILNFQGQGVRDEVWIPRMAREDWILITADKSWRRKGKGEPLSRLCVRCGVTHVVLSQAVSKRRSFEKMLTVLSVWYEVLGLDAVPRGSRFMIESAGNGPEHRGKGKLVRKQVPPEIVPPPPKGRLPFPPID
jgi:PIN like domain